MLARVVFKILLTLYKYIENITQYIELSFRSSQNIHLFVFHLEYGYDKEKAYIMEIVDEIILNVVLIIKLSIMIHMFPKSNLSSLTNSIPKKSKSSTFNKARIHCLAINCVFARTIVFNLLRSAVHSQILEPPEG